eukprot:3135901-Prymnesium_polylepis.1
MASGVLPSCEQTAKGGSIVRAVGEGWGRYSRRAGALQWRGAAPRGLRWAVPPLTPWARRRCGRGA